MCLLVGAPLVAPLLIGRVSGRPVELHAHGETLVEVVEVPIAGALPDPGLPTSGRKPMRAFHAMHVAGFEQRQGSLPGIGKRQSKVPTPSHLLTGLHGVP